MRQEGKGGEEGGGRKKGEGGEKAQIIQLREELRL